MAAHILIVEDEDLLRIAISAKLRTVGYQVTTAEDGQEGLAAALKTKPDLILLDVLMPIMDGFTMLAKLREDSWGAKAVVIFLTNSSDLQDVNSALQTGSKDYIIKSNTSLDDIVRLASEHPGVKH
jgi:DNA-binding response OmpR family regulator